MYKYGSRNLTKEGKRCPPDFDNNLEDKFKVYVLCKTSHKVSYRRKFYKYSYFIVNLHEIFCDRAYNREPNKYMKVYTFSKFSSPISKIILWC